MNKTTSSINTLELGRIRIRLDRHPKRQDAVSIQKWGHDVESLINAYKDTSTVQAVDALRVKTYLDYMADLPAGMLMEEAGDDLRYTVGMGLLPDDVISARPRYDGLRDVCEALQTFDKPHPVIKKLLSLHWHPERLVHAMNEVLNTQTDYLSKMADGDIYLSDTAQGHLLQSLLPLVGSKIELPKSPVWGQLWDVYYLDNPSTKEITQSRNFISTMRTDNPEADPQALYFLYMYSDGIPDELFAEFFPLNLDQCDPAKLLDTLIGIWAQENDSRDEIAHEVSVHHPKLAAMLDIHLSLFPDIDFETTYVNILFNGVREMFPAPKIDSVANVSGPSFSI